MPIHSLSTNPSPGKICLADLCRTYKAQWCAITERDVPDEQIERFCNTELRATVDALSETPVETAADALAALDYILIECDGFNIDETMLHLVQSLRNWIAAAGDFETRITGLEAMLVDSENELAAMKGKRA